MAFGRGVLRVAPDLARLEAPFAVDLALVAADFAVDLAVLVTVFAVERARAVACFTVERAFRVVRVAVDLALPATRSPRRADEPTAVRARLRSRSAVFARSSARSRTLSAVASTAPRAAYPASLMVSFMVGPLSEGVLKKTDNLVILAVWARTEPTDR